jgi:glycosyl hydrolase family 123
VRPGRGAPCAWRAIAIALATALACRPEAAVPAAVRGPGAAPAASPGVRVGLVHGTMKVRPGTPVPGATRIALEAARNEFEPYQVVVGGGARGAKAITARAGPLERVDGAARIGVENVRLYREVLYEALRRSNVEGGRGAWPDALVPDVDAYDGQRRNAFPFDVPPGESRAVWVDVYVPKGTPAGEYRGTVEVASAGAPIATLSVALRVRDFDLPSTSTLRSAFGLSVDAVCRAHAGGRFCRDATQATPLVEKYVRAALDHRVTLMAPYYALPSGTSWRELDEAVAPFLDGNARTRLPGARITAFRASYRRRADPGWERSRAELVRAHFRERGWADRLFDYAYDEPHACVPDVAARARVAHAAGIRTLVTTDLDRLQSCGWEDDVDILCPLVNQMHPAGGASERARYGAFLSRPGKELWWYQSCMSHGCHEEASCSDEQERDTARGYPSYAIDAPAVLARAMEWLSFSYGVTGELYYDTVAKLDTAWRRNGLCGFGGQGDGTLFYPGRPDVIGGTTDVPVETVRLKLLREGMEDYEYLHLLASLGGDRREADEEARRVFPAAPRASETTAEALYEGRRRIADRIERLLAARSGSARR